MELCMVRQSVPLAIVWFGSQFPLAIFKNCPRQQCRFTSRVARSPPHPPNRMLLHCRGDRGSAATPRGGSRSSSTRHCRQAGCAATQSVCSS